MKKETEWVLITPEMAEEMLRKNTRNRKPKRTYIISLSDDLKNGRWVPRIAEPISLGVDGVVLNGQHRLMAIVYSGVPMLAEIRHHDYDSPRGLPFDVGQGRTPADLLLEDSRVAHVVRFFASMSSSDRKKVLLGDLVDWCEIVGPCARKLLDLGTKKTRTGISTAGLRTGFVLKMMENNWMEDDLILSYVSIVTDKPSQMHPSSMSALFNQLIDGAVIHGLAGSLKQNSELCRTVKALDNPNAERIVIRDQTVLLESIRSRMRAVREKARSNQ